MSRICKVLSSLVSAVVLTAGCAVPQGPGGGKLLHLQEPRTARWYWLYLPERYPDRAAGSQGPKLWPLVMTFHGMKPFDNANSQIREWQQQADAYGLIVCAPELLTSDLLMEFPLRHTHWYLQSDEQAILAVMDQIFQNTDADPDRVLATSWSSGGYVAHYMLNGHPERFSCLAVRQSNFSASILEPGQAKRYHDYPIAIFFGQNDFPICQRESRQAVAWYRARGFKVDAFRVEGLGHERTPETAANYFARACNRRPLDRALAQRTLAPIRMQPVLLARAEPGRATGRIPAQRSLEELLAAGAGRPAGGTAVALAAGRLARSAAQTNLQPRQPRPTSPRELTYRRLTRADVPAKPPPPPAPLAPPVTIRISSFIGVAPLHVAFELKLPPDLAAGADCLWTDNGMPIGNGLRGQKILRAPGQHRIAALAVTRDGRELRAEQVVRVLPRTLGVAR